MAGQKAACLSPLPSSNALLNSLDPAIISGTLHLVSAHGVCQSVSVLQHMHLQVCVALRPVTYTPHKSLSVGVFMSSQLGTRWSVSREAQASSGSNACARTQAVTHVQVPRQ